MAETKEEVKTKEKKESKFMTQAKALETKDRVKERVRDYTEEYTDMGQELTRLVRGSYLNSFQLGLSFWERNLKIIGRQIEQWMSMQEEYTKLIGTVIPGVMVHTQKMVSP